MVGSGFTVFVFMALAWLAGPAWRIGKIPGPSPNPHCRYQGRPG
jgi:hypothetical protein